MGHSQLLDFSIFHSIFCWFHCTSFLVRTVRFTARQHGIPTESMHHARYINYLLIYLLSRTCLFLFLSLPSSLAVTHSKHHRKMLNLSFHWSVCNRQIAPHTEFVQSSAVVKAAVIKPKDKEDYVSALSVYTHHRVFNPSKLPHLVTWHYHWIQQFNDTFVQNRCVNCFQYAL